MRLMKPFNITYSTQATVQRDYEISVMAKSSKDAHQKLLEGGPFIRKVLAREALLSSEVDEDSLSIKEDRGNIDVV